MLDTVVRTSSIAGETRDSKSTCFVCLRKIIMILGVFRVDSRNRWIYDFQHLPRTNIRSATTRFPICHGNVHTGKEETFIKISLHDAVRDDGTPTSHPNPAQLPGQPFGTANRHNRNPCCEIGLLRFARSGSDAGISVIDTICHCVRRSRNFACDRSLSGFYRIIE